MEAVGSRQSPLSCHLSRCPGTEVPSLRARYALPRYYEPLRLPPRPGLPLAGLRLSSSFLAKPGLPCSFGFPLHACHHLYSGGLPRCSSRSLRPVSPDSGFSSRRMPAFPQNQRDRHPHYPFRSFLGVHSCYGLRAPLIPLRGLFLKCLSDFVTSITPPGGSGRSEQFPGGFALSLPLETRGFSRRTDFSGLDRQQSSRGWQKRRR